MRQCKDKGHISHPQEKPRSTSTGGRGGGGQDGYIILGGVGRGVPAKPGSYIFLDAFVMMQNTLANQPPKSGWKIDICSGSDVFFYVEKVMDFHLKGADIRFCRSLSENDASLIHRSWSNLGVTESPKENLLKVCCWLVNW